MVYNTLYINQHYTKSCYTSKFIVISIKINKN